MMCMQPMIKRILWVGLLACGWPTAWAYSLGGPIGNGGDAWQVPVIGYGLGGDLNAPKNIGEEYRRNQPTNYYAFDVNFLEFFGSQGASAVDGAFAILNALTNVDSYSTSLSEFPIESRHVNYQAQALGLLDLKSETLGLMVEQLGLADPIRYDWTLHDRYHAGNIACPVGMEYLVVERNFDIVSTPLNQIQYSPYVNNTLYSYQIYEACTGPNPLAVAEPFAVDPLADTYSPVASFAVGLGDYYTGLTRDDMAGLRYLLSTNNVNKETAAPGSLLYGISTNFTSPQVFPPYLSNSTNAGGYYIYTGTTNGGIGYGDLAAFLSFASTNNLANLQAAYPGVNATLVTNSWAIVSNATYSSYFTNAGIGSPYGSPPRFVTVTNYIPAFQLYYYYNFANVFTNHYYTNRSGFWQTVSVSAPTGSPYGTPAVTNTTLVLTNQIAGDFFVLTPFYTGVFSNNNRIMTNVCPLDFVSPPITTVQAVTNYLTGGTTNTGTVNYSNSVSLVVYYTNYSYVIYPVTCATTAAATGLYQGIGNIKYVRADYDSLIGQYWHPRTNSYAMVALTNSQWITQQFQQIITTPDILFTAQDMANGPAGVPGVAYGARSLTFNQANILPGLAGPGTITSPTTITYDKVGPVYYNSTGDVLDGTPYFNSTPGGDVADLFYAEYFIWASYDGTTNAPVVFPNGTSIDNLQSQVVMQLSPTSLAGGFTDVPYLPVTFTATGGSFSQPYTWSATGLPDGMSVSAGGMLSGTPTVAGTFDFTLTLTDNVGRSIQWIYTITIQ